MSLYLLYEEMKSNQFNKNGEVDIDSLLAEIDNKVAKASAFSVQSRGGVDDASSLQARGGAKASSQSQTPRDVATSVDKGKNRQDDDTDSNSDDGEEVFLVLFVCKLRRLCQHL